MLEGDEFLVRVLVLLKDRDRVDVGDQVAELLGELDAEDDAEGLLLPVRLPETPSVGVVVSKGVAEGSGTGASGGTGACQNHSIVYGVPGATSRCRMGGGQGTGVGGSFYLGRATTFGSAEQGKEAARFAL